jgi:T3SS (YopN, CesT) and YbjN peptide-binding chaperone 3
MPTRKARAALVAWLADADRALAEQCEQSISPTIHGTHYGETHLSDQTLGDFAPRLPELLGRLTSDPGRWILIVEVTASANRYVQLIAFEDGSLVTEAVSNINLDPAEQWNAEHEELLARIGWSRPEEDGSPNWWKLYPTVTPPVDAVARMLLCTLRTVFGLGGRDLLTTKVFSSPRRGRTPASASTG